MEKEPWKFCGALIIFHEVMKLQSFKFGVSEVIPAIVHNISPLSFVEKESFTEFYSVFNFFLRSYKVMKFE